MANRLKKNNPGCNCCDEGGIYCANCAGSGINACETMVLEIAGVADGGAGECTTCDDANGTYILGFQKDLIFETCLWRVESQSWCGQGFGLSIVPTRVDGTSDFKWTVRLFQFEGGLPETVFVVWEETLASAPDCLLSSGLEVPYDNDSQGTLAASERCDYTSSTATIVCQ